jgi:ADP-heptose:LPS heptosyltransferase
MYFLCFKTAGSRGRGHKIKYKHFFYDIKIEIKTGDKPIHSVENHFKLVKALDVKAGRIPCFKLPPAKEAEAEKILEFLSKNKLGDTRIIALHIGAGNEFRKWGLQKLNRLIDLLSRISKVSTVLIGGPEDLVLEEQILNESSIPMFSLVGHLNLRELKEFISQSSLFIGPDSDPMHITASTGTPIVACFGPALSATFGPWRTSSTIIEKDYPCRPCSQKKCIYGDFRCFQDITPGEIYQASCGWLSG